MEIDNKKKHLSSTRIYNFVILKVVGNKLKKEKFHKFWLIPKQIMMFLCCL